VIVIETNNISTESSRRLFLACWPDQTLQELLYDLARRLQLEHGGNRTRKENIHLTLIFLGQVQEHKERQLRRKLRTLDIKQFDLELDESGAFTHCRVNWVGPRLIPQGLKDLHNALGLISREFTSYGEERSYKPHVSLLHNSQTEIEFDIKPMSWKVDRYCLIESKQKNDGVEYEIIEEFPLIKH
jgi:2'-5' RNA ligase